ncbi:hypothetical protein HGRIS_004165 [Hohenbuehelia grisea]|uniref:AP180 N-terminal homology (ANTH) domain-containing protein n=1 Tax=Hohenbuehelia grisea TaxID=104357 RepID=A0ABR3JIH9_9AGAR
MIRNGATDNVLTYLSSSEVLRLRNVSSGNWEGYTAPQNLQHYASYLDSRIRAYRDLKHDAVRVQAESNRDLRNTNSIEEDTYRAKQGRKQTSTTPTRSKTIMGRKLRVMTVEKGLLRETKAVQRMIDSLVECRFYLDDLEDQLITTSLRMLVKDLLILFQAGNEGVINVLENYFEMSHVDAKEALGIYRNFCEQTERVVEYLSVAKKLQNLLNVPIPNLKHAPVSLAGALQEYLDDPNFEQNRLEYKANKRAADGKPPKPTPAKTSPPPVPKVETAAPVPSSSTPASGPSNQSNTIPDFFSSIEEQQPSMFNPQTNSPNGAYFHQQAVSNPFVQMQMTGMPFVAQPQQQFQPQAPNPFGFLSPQAAQIPQTTGHRPFSSYLPPQTTGFLQQQQPMPQMVPQATGFLQPQATGSNPFRQSMLLPQSTGMALFGVGTPNGMHSAPPLPNQGQGPATTSFSAFASSTPGSSTPFGQPSPFPQQPTSSGIQVPPRPASTPLTSFGSASSPSATSPPVVQPVKSHQTGSKNPFGPIVTPVPPVPKPPTLMELTMGVGNMNIGNSSANMNGQQQNGFTSAQQQQQAQPTNQPSSSDSFGFGSSALSPGVTDISSVASSFAFNNKPTAGSGSNQGPSAFPPLGGLRQQDTSATNSTSTTTTGPSLFSQPTGATSLSSAPSISFSSPVKPQFTGFSGLKPFKPSSSFGASLLESLPPIPGSAPTTPAVTGGNPGQLGSSPSTGTSSGPLPSQPTGFGAFSAQPTGSFGAPSNASGFGAPSSAFGGSSLGQGLRPQMTGGASNPFRASMMMTGSGGLGGSGAGVPPLPTGYNSGAAGDGGTGTALFGGGAGTGSTHNGLGSSIAFGQSTFGQGTFSAGAGAFSVIQQPAQQQQQQQPQQQQQGGTASLI